ncbi:MAG: SPFH domain-containing protein [Bryobacteraceae bacterium]
MDSAPLAKARAPEDLAAVNATLSDWAAFVAATEAFAARRTFLRLDVAACERNSALSDPGRLNEIEEARTAHIRRVTQRWQDLAGASGKEFESGLIAQVNAVYEAETKSFYNSAMEHFEDRDIGKDYPNLPLLIQNSTLDPGTKSFYQDGLRFLRYEEAGQLTNVLTGLDKDQGLNYAYLMRKALADRIAAAAEKRAQLTQEQDETRNKTMIHYAIEGSTGVLILAALWVLTDRTRAKYRAYRKGLKRSPFWFGNAEWIFWEPGETVVLLEHKRLVPMMDPQGGYCTISAWKGQEYKGRISYKTQFSTWKSDPIITSDGLAVNLAVGIWWRITNPGTYVSAIASDYHEGEQHRNENLGEAAEFWIKKLAAGTLREEVNQLPAEKLISPYVQAYLQVRRGPEGELLPEGNALPNFSEQLGKAEHKLNEKTLRYGIEIERLEVQELILPPIYQQKLEAVRVAFLEPSQARALTEAQVIALQGLASVIGPEKVGLIEVLKHVDISHVSMNPFTGTIPIVQPVIDALHQQTQKALPPGIPKGLPPDPNEPKSR